MRTVDESPNRPGIRKSQTLTDASPDEAGCAGDENRLIAPLHRTVFVTGATGFSGGRICERLVLANAGPVRALVHSPHKAARIARLPIAMPQGSLLDSGSLRSAMGVAKVVIPSGLGNSPATFP